MASANERPRAILYNYSGSVWGSIPELGLIEKGYNQEDVERKVVDLSKGENFAPSYLKINPNGTVPTLVAPIADTTSPEVATKFRAITDSKEILEFLDSSRSQAILEQSGQQDTAKSAPALAPATIEGKAASDALISYLHSPELDPNFLLVAARSADELQKERQGFVASFVNARVEAIEKYKAAVAEEATDNPRSVAQNEALKKWYEEKQQTLAPLSLTYGPKSNDQASSLHIQLSRSRQIKLAEAFEKLETTIKGPYALGDQISLADIHLIAWLARVIFVAEIKEGAKGLDALVKALGHESCQSNGLAEKVGPKVRAYWELVGQRPSFKQVYRDGPH